MKHWMIATSLAVLSVPVLIAQPRRQPTNSSSSLPAGVYIELTPCVRCYRCAPCTLENGWQRPLLNAFRKAGIKAWLGDHRYDGKALRDLGIRKLQRINRYENSVFVGPYASAQEGREAFKQVCLSAADDPAECHPWPEKETEKMTTGFINGIWATLTEITDVPPR